MEFRINTWSAPEYAEPVTEVRLYDGDLFDMCVAFSYDPKTSDRMIEQAQDKLIKAWDGKGS